MPKKGYTYITTNKNHTVLYTGATSTLKDRIDCHRSKKYKHSFSARYNTDKLVWYQKIDWIGDALEMERKIKAGSRKKKLDLINAMNPDWHDLYDDLTEYAAASEHHPLISPFNARLCEGRSPEAVASALSAGHPLS